MKILCMGDSLSLPGHLNRYEDTWIYKLKKHFTEYDFITYFRRALTTDVLFTMGGGPGDPDGFGYGSDCLEAYKPDIVILQLGIVDCAPRLFRQTGIEKYFIKLLPKAFKNYYINIIKKYRKRSSSRSYTSPKDFHDCLYNYFKRCKDIGLKIIIIIGIPFPGIKMIDKNSDVINSVKKYNDIYNKLVSKYNFAKIIYPLDSRKYDYEIFQDGYHPNKVGHDLIFNDIRKILDEFKNN